MQIVIRITTGAGIGCIVITFSGGKALLVPLFVPRLIPSHAEHAAKVREKHTALASCIRELLMNTAEESDKRINKPAFTCHASMPRHKAESALSSHRSGNP
ncbi:hypothetical protein M0R45_009986 [Rubus argutus]|uniref:Uncharacterized protein n=1 Tax=Rubus argutus TaxID=59490 RepID=A0AAW1Y5P2_RUBAR